MAGDLENQLRLTQDQLRERVRMGDRLEAARQIEHSAEFSHRGQARAAARDLEACGYSVKIGRRGFKALLEASKSSPIDSATAEAFVREVVGIVERYGGSYDGWGGTVE